MTATAKLASHPIRERAFSVQFDDGRTMSGHRWSGRGAPVVALHGLLDCSLGWESVARTSTRPFVALDLPGFGDSDMPTRPRISAYAEDVVAALDALGIDEFVLVGHSLGGAVAAAVAERCQRRAIALVLLAPAGFGRQPLAEAASLPGMAQVVAAGLPLALVNPLARNGTYRLAVANGRAPDAALDSRLAARAFASAPGALAATRAIAAAGRSPRSFARRRVGYAGPVTAVFGTADRLVPAAHGKRVARALPQSEVLYWKGMGHHPQVERPEELAGVIASAGEVGSLRRRRAA